MQFSRSLRAAATALLLIATLGATSAPAQIGGALRGAASRLGGKLPVGGLLEGKPPITTSLEDAKWADASKDNFTPREAERSLMQLQRTPNGGFVLQPGYWTMDVQSYCLKAGTHGPGGGDGYLYAPPKGPAEDAVMTIVRNSVNHPEIDQHKIQTLLWAIIARAKFEDLSSEHKAIASRLLTPRQLVSLNRSALDVLSNSALTDALGGVPEPLRQIAQAEAQLRQMLTTPGATFAEMERVAVLSGNAPLGQNSREVPSGRWSLHPDGYYVRYLPRAYSNTRVEIWVPQGNPSVGKEFDPATHIAVPGNTSRQRLIQSGRPQHG
ncbi:hypothetical protein E2493_06575 [Sphingomonas parva]|uniref:Uncharacterized protein n=1 Tax=Sphingomonas parva TaxID=2555898 RepID=A0A4Y8ZT35_9SPHN|nr:hypothetical protein [Sphingomonas parva]TFI59183.1 hypothetical protein E2493_06575 [Sphingomonas parva]